MEARDPATPPFPLDPPPVSVEWQALDPEERGFFEAKDKLLPIGQLKWDTEMKHGQTCGLYPKHVERIMSSFDISPLSRPAEVLVWHDGRMSSGLGMGACAISSLRWKLRG